MSTPTNDCNCCAGVTAQTPAEVTNRPGLSAVAYRVGTQSRFKQSMLAALSDVTRPALQGLKTRADDDPAIALLDAAATMADVLTFYQERIANESYLRTATERRSLLELARLIGYELRPGVAASTFLAFALDESPGAPAATAVAAGTKVQSVPGPDEVGHQGQAGHDDQVAHHDRVGAREDGLDQEGSRAAGGRRCRGGRLPCRATRWRRAMSRRGRCSPGRVRCGTGDTETA